MKERNPFLTFLLAFVFGAPAILLWLGRFQTALIFYLLESLIAVLLIVLFRAGFDPILTSLPVPGAASAAYYAAHFVFALLAIAIAFRVYRLEARPVWYADWKVSFLGLAFAGFLVAMVVRAFGIQPFSIPASSMHPTLRVGDIVFVSKSAYGYSKHSFPFSALPIDGRIFPGSPKRGDIVVFKNLQNVDFVKRIVGLPGETVSMRGGVLQIDGKPVGMKPVADADSANLCPEGNSCSASIETLPEGVSHVVVSLADGTAADDTPDFKVPDGHYFMMGDNRDNSNDSRFMLGFIPYENLVGPLWMVIGNTEGIAYDGRPDLK